MKLELRKIMSEDHTQQLVRGVVFIAENEAESSLLDTAFGTDVHDDDGVIDSRERKVECRLSDGYGEHYVYIDMLVSVTVS